MFDYYKAIKENPKSFKNHFERGNSRIELGEYDKALSDLLKAKELDLKNEKPEIYSLISTLDKELPVLLKKMDELGLEMII